ncbi:MAG: hypothetical protein KC502_01835 [Myxococcales bacterium]|nr:hypothetical protein [Myxococcales bacterium]
MNGRLAGAFQVIAPTVALMLLATSGCMEIPVVETGSKPALAIGESREVSLHALRLQVSSYEQVLTRQDMLALPLDVREKLWLYNLDLRGEAGEQRLIDNALANIRSLDIDDPSLGGAERNMVRLLNMSPANADLTGTPMAQLLGLAPQVGIAAQEVLAQSLGVEVSEPFLGGEALAGAVVDGVISSHPNARRRPIHVSPEHPTGEVPVPAGHLPVTLEAVVTDLQSLTTTYGPVSKAGQSHPGFMTGATKASLLTPEFHMVVRANANALPYKGVDLSHGERGSVTSIGKEAAPLFDFDDPEWMRVVGIEPKPAVTEMSFRMVEAPVALQPGTSPLPKPMGNGSVWSLPKWSLERVVADAGLRAFKERTWSKSWVLGSDPTPLFEVTIRNGWMELETKGNLGKPPAPLYLWDLMILVAQRRLHDGPNLEAPEVGRIAEGDASVQFTLKDVSIGVTHKQITDAIRRNLEADPTSLVSVASRVLDQSAGAPDVYYVRPKWDAPTAEQGDWLFFIHADDQTSGTVRTYAQPGFFADSGLTQPLHVQTGVVGDTKHMKVRISSGQTLYCGDDTGAAFRIDVLAKPSQLRVRLRITRVR